MFNRKSSYALNKKDPDAIVYMDANEVIIRLTREDFASEEEFLKWKSWSDGNYHTEDNQDVVEGKHNTSIDDLSEAALSIPAIDVVMERQHEKSERCRMASTMVSQIRDKLTETQFRRLWMYYVGGIWQAQRCTFYFGVDQKCWHQQLRCKGIRLPFFP